MVRRSGNVFERRDLFVYDEGMSRTNDKPPVALRTLHFYWQVTALQWPLFLCAVLVTMGFVFFLSYMNPFIMGKIIDLVSAGRVEPDQVLPVFGPLMLALVGVNVLGQACSKLQDYFASKVAIRASYELATRTVDTGFSRRCVPYSAGSMPRFTTTPARDRR